MLFGESIEDTRAVLYQAWQKHLQKQPLAPLEQNIVNIISEHPEYHGLLSNPKQPYLPIPGETNPFMHIGLHITLAEQIHLNNPVGITPVFERLRKKSGDTHKALHKMMDALIETVSQMMTQHQPFNAEQYLERLKKL